MATWPTRKQYVGAVQRAPSTFRMSALQTAQFRTDAMLGMPTVSSGQTALVFRATMGNEDKAVRVFTAEAAAGQDRYRALAEHQRQARVPSIAEAIWLDDALEIDHGLYPVVVMEWVEGDSLSTGVENRLSQPGTLTAMAARWQQQIAELGASRFAHGDLQHGNVIVDATNSFRFIDLDGVWVPNIAAHPPSEFGHPNYQHPDRTSGQVWGEHIDWFSALVVYVSLAALAVDPSLWRYAKGENLLFLAEDYQTARAPIWGDLAASPSPDVASLSAVLAACCSSDPLAPTNLATILQLRSAPAAPGVQFDAGAGSPGSNGADTPASGGNEWWVTTPASSGGPSPGSVASEPSAAGPNSNGNDWWVTTESSTGARRRSSPPPQPGPVGPKDRVKAPKQQVNADWAAAGQSRSSGSSYKQKKQPPPPPGVSAPYASPSGPAAVPRPVGQPDSSDTSTEPQGPGPEDVTFTEALSGPLHEWLYGIAIVLIILAVALRASPAALIPALLGFVVAIVGIRRERRWKQEQQ